MKPPRRSKLRASDLREPPGSGNVIEPVWLKERTKDNAIKRILRDKDQPWWWRKVVGPAMDRFNDSLPDSRRLDDGPGQGLYQIPGKQFCRFRRDGTCFFPQEIDVQGSEQAGYSVWVPFNRGQCPWKTKRAQKVKCQVSEPGPDSGEKVTYPDATISWADGGQRAG